MPAKSAATASSNTVPTPTATARPPAAVPSVSAAAPRPSDQTGNTTMVTGSAPQTDSKSNNGDPVNKLDIKAIAGGLVAGAKRYLQDEKSDDKGKGRATRVQCFAEFLSAALIAEENTASAAADTPSQAQQIIKKYILLLYETLKKINSTLFKKYVQAEIEKIKLMLDAPDTRSLKEIFTSKPAPKNYPTQWLEKYIYTRDEKQFPNDISNLEELLDSGSQQNDQYLSDMIIYSLAEEWQQVIALPDQQRDANVKVWNDYWKVCEKSLNKYYLDVNKNVDQWVADEEAAERQKQTELQAARVKASERAQFELSTTTSLTTTATDTKQINATDETVVTMENIRQKYTALTMKFTYSVSSAQSEYNRFSERYSSKEYIKQCSYKQLAQLMVDTFDELAKAYPRKYDALIKLLVKFNNRDEMPSAMFVLLLGAFAVVSYQQSEGHIVKLIFNAIQKKGIGLPPTIRYAGKDLTYAERANNSCYDYLSDGYRGEPVLYIAHAFLPFKIWNGYIWSKDFSKVNILNRVLSDAVEILKQSFKLSEKDDVSLKDRLIAKLEDAVSIAYIKLIREICHSEEVSKNIYYKIIYLNDFVGYIRANRIGMNPAERVQLADAKLDFSAVPKPKPIPTPSAPPPLPTENSVASNTEGKAKDDAKTTSSSEPQEGVADVKVGDAKSCDAGAAPAQNPVIISASGAPNPNLPPPPPYSATASATVTASASTAVPLLPNPVLPAAAWSPLWSTSSSNDRTTALTATRQAMGTLLNGLANIQNTSSDEYASLSLLLAALAQEHSKLAQTRVVPQPDATVHIVVANPQPTLWELPTPTL